MRRAEKWKILTVWNNFWGICTECTEANSCNTSYVSCWPSPYDFWPKKCIHVPYWNIFSAFWCVSVWCVSFFSDWKKSFHHPQYSYFHFLLFALMHTHAECFAKKMNHLPSFYSEILQREMMICRWVLEKTSRRHAGEKFDEMLNQYKLNAAHWFAEINNVEKCNL